MVTALVGGVIIGLSATLLLLINGRIFGITGIVAGLFNKPGPDFVWRSSIVLGLIFGSWLLSFFAPEFFFLSLVKAIILLARAFSEREYHRVEFFGSFQGIGRF